MASLFSARKILSSLSALPTRCESAAVTGWMFASSSSALSMSPRTLLSGPGAACRTISGSAGSNPVGPSPSTPSTPSSTSPPTSSPSSSSTSQPSHTLPNSLPSERASSSAMRQRTSTAADRIAQIVESANRNVANKRSGLGTSHATSSPGRSGYSFFLQPSGGARGATPSASAASSGFDISSASGGGGGGAAPLLASPLRHGPLTRTDYQTRIQTPGIEPYHLHAYCHRHNTHVTLTNPNREVLVSMSAGNVGFRKGRRKLYDSAFQLTAHVFKVIEHQGWLADKNAASLEVIYRDFGPGREAFTKVLLGSEGTSLREKIVRVTDASRFKYGGTRSPKPRRLG